MKKNIWWIVIGPIIIAIFGTIGYCKTGLPVYTSFVASLDFVLVNFERPAENIFVEAARWGGLLYCGTAAIAVVQTAVERLRISKQAKSGQIVAIHGDGILAETLSKNMGAKAMLSNDSRSLAAKTHVILFEDDCDSLDYYHRNMDKLRHADKVFLHLSDVQRDKKEVENVVLFNLAENTARQFWIDNPAYSHEKIVLIGSGALAENLLTLALLTNIDEIENGIEYHVIGDFNEYRALHFSLQDAVEAGRDKVYFYGDVPWHTQIDVILSADMIILSQETNDNIHIASKLISMGLDSNSVSNGRDTRVFLYTANEKTALLFDDLIQPFGTAARMCCEENVMEDWKRTAGIICNAVYQLGTKTHSLNSITAEDVDRYIRSKEGEDDWNRLSDFNRRSNYALSSHDMHKEKLMNEVGIDSRGLSVGDNDRMFRALPQEDIDRLQHIEYIRWSRFLYINNWTYGDERDDQRQVHNCLVKYEDLPDEMRDYDGFFYESLPLRLQLYPEGISSKLSM